MENLKIDELRKKKKKLQQCILIGLFLEIDGLDWRSDGSLYRAYNGLS